MVVDCLRRPVSSRLVSGRVSLIFFQTSHFVQPSFSNSTPSHRPFSRLVEVDFDPQKRSSAGIRNGSTIATERKPESETKSESERTVGKTSGNPSRYLFLGQYTQAQSRADAGFSPDDYKKVIRKSSGEWKQRNEDRTIDEIFELPYKNVIDHSPVTVSGYVRHGQVTLRQFHVDNDLDALDSFIKTVENPLHNINHSLISPAPKSRRSHEKIRPDQYYKRVERLQRTKFFTRFKGVLRAYDLDLIRATCTFLGQEFIDRPFIVGLYRLIIRNLAERGEWRLLVEVLEDVIYERVSNRTNLVHRSGAELVGFVLSLSLRLGQPKVREVHILLDHFLNSSSPGWEHTSIQTSSAVYSKMPLRVQISDLNSAQSAPEPSPQRAQNLQPSPTPRQIDPGLADTQIRFYCANLLIDSAVEIMDSMIAAKFVPHHKSINAVLQALQRTIRKRDWLRRPLTDPKGPSTIGKVELRPYHRSIPDPVRFDFYGRDLFLPNSTNLPILQRLVKWENVSSSVMTRTNVHMSERRVLDNVVKYLNRHNIHYSTVRLLAQLAGVDTAWKITMLSKDPKGILKKVQKEFVEAASNCLLPLSRNRATELMVILRLENAGIKPSKDALFAALRAMILKCNVRGSRTLINRIRWHGYMIEQHEAAELCNMLSFLATEGSMDRNGWMRLPFARNELVEFVAELRRFIRDPSFLGPYVLAVGSLGSSVEIWSTWKSVTGSRLKDGLITAFVQAFVRARDIPSAMEFIKAAYARGYALNFVGLREIAGALRPGDENVGRQLLEHLIAQKTILNADEVKTLLRCLLSGRAEAAINTKEQNLILDDLSVQLTTIAKSRLEGTDVNEAVELLGTIVAETQIPTAL